MTRREQCKRCGAALPPGVVRMAECPSCGALHGLLPESQAYIDAVFEGAKSLPTPPIMALSAVFVPDPEGPFGYRSEANAASAGTLRVAFVPRHTAISRVNLVLGALALLFVPWTFFRVGVQAWLFAPAAIILGVALVLLARIRMKTSITIADGVLTYEDVPFGFWKRVQHHIAARDIRQLYVAHLPPTKNSSDVYELRLRRHDGNTLTLERFYTPTLPLLLEAFAERGLALTDQPEAEEVDRATPQPAVRPVHRYLGLALVVVCVATAIGVERSPGSLTSHVLPRDGTTVQSRVSLWAPTTLTFHSTLAFSRKEPKPGNATPAFPSLEGTPRSAVILLEVHGDSRAPQELRCDPHALSGPMTSIEAAGAGVSSYRLSGGMKGCTVRLPRGEYTLTLQQERLPGAQPAGLVQSAVEVRFKRSVWMR